MDAPAFELLEPSLLHQQIDACLMALDAQGISVDIEQRVRLNALLLQLVAERRLPRDPDALCRMVTPILAGSPDQQAICQATFKSIFAAKQDDPPVGFDRRGAAEQDDSHHSWKGQTWLARGLIGGASVLLLAAGLYIAFTSKFGLFRHQSANVEHSGFPPTVSASGIAWITNYPIEEFEPPHQAPWNRSLRWFYTEYDAPKMIALLLPWIMCVGVLGFLYSRLLAFLRREALKQNLRSLDLRLGNVSRQFGDRRLIDRLQPLRGLPRTHLRTFDAERTALASAEAAGLLQPRFKEVAVPTDFVILLDRQSAQDHLAAYNMEVVRSLRNVGLSIELLEFNCDPTICYFTRMGEFVRLEGVVRRFPDSILFIFASAEQLIDPSHDRLLPSVTFLREARRAILLTPEVDLAESALEMTLIKRLGISIVRTTPAGVSQLASLFVSTDDPSGAAPHTSDGARSSLAALVDFFTDRPGRWMQTVAPRKEDRSELQQHLHRALRPEIFRWLIATAIYPELHWPLTLSLKNAVSDPDHQGRIFDSELLAISRLPWFRNGWMPDWVRGLLQHALPNNSPCDSRCPRPSQYTAWITTHAHQCRSRSGRAERTHASRRHYDSLFADGIATNATAVLFTECMGEEIAAQAAVTVCECCSGSNFLSRHDVVHSSILNSNRRMRSPGRKRGGQPANWTRQ
jgi:hypothetical protein